MNRSVRRQFRALLAAVLLGLALAAQASEPLVFDSPEQEERFKRLTHELRCVVCQNQSLADSDAQLAHDLRKELYDMVVAGKGDEEIKSFLVDRYGEFVLYRPPLRADTVFLWIAPILFLGIGAVVIGYNIRRRKTLLMQEEKELTT
ncbi:MAG: cytochrome c-type biogenesis protein CcmH [Gammaproteobacteria bacterium]